METLSYQNANDKWLKKTSYFNNHSKCKWTDLTNKKTQNCRLDQIQNPTICCLQETHLSSKDKCRPKVKEWKMIFQANGIQRKRGVAVLIFDEIDFKIKKSKERYWGHFIMI